MSFLLLVSSLRFFTLVKVHERVTIQINQVRNRIRMIGESVDSHFIPLLDGCLGISLERDSVNDETD